MTVAELAAWLLAFEDQEAIVLVLQKKEEDRDFYNYYIEEADFDPDVHVEYTDLRGNRFVHPDAPHFNGRWLLLGLT